MNNDLNNIYGVNNDSTLDPTRESNPTIEPTPMPAMGPTPMPAMGPTPVQTVEPVSMSAMGPTPVQTAEPASVQTMGPTSMPEINLNKEDIMEILNTDGKSFSRPWFGQLMTGPQLMAYLCQVNMWLETYKPEIEI